MVPPCLPKVRVSPLSGYKQPGEPVPPQSTLAGVALLLAYGPAQADRPPGQVGVDWGTPAGQECVDCHMTENPGL